MARKLMTPDEVRRMPADRELVFVAGFRPVYGKKIRYYEQKYFMDRVLDPPLFSDTATQIQSYAQLFAVHAAERRKIEARQEEVARARSGIPAAAHDAPHVSSDAPAEMQQTPADLHAEDGALAAETTETHDAERRSAYLSASHAAILAWAKEQGADLRKGA